MFAHLFQQSIDMGEIPKEWSLANKCPPFITEDRSLACNYRPVFLTCVSCKLLEHIVCSDIMAHLDEHKLLTDRRHAFRKRHGCETQLIIDTVINDWAKILDKGGQIDTFILDFEKAFDTSLMNYLKQAVWLWYRWKDFEMDRFFSLFQAAASCSKWNRIRLDLRVVSCPSRYPSWTIVGLIVY